jgi:hypothetical protein
MFANILNQFQPIGAKAVDDDNFTDILLNEELCNYLKNKNE